MAWPSDVSTGQVITAAHMNAVKDAIATWGGNVTAAGFSLSNVSALTVSSATLDSQVYISSGAPRLGFGDNATYASRAHSVRLGLATAATHFLPSAAIGDFCIFTEQSTLTSGRGAIRFATASGSSFAFSERLSILQDGKVGINKTAPLAQFAVVGLSNYADNAAAVAGGLTTGDFYHTSGDVKVVT